MWLDEYMSMAHFHMTAQRSWYAPAVDIIDERAHVAEVTRAITRKENLDGLQEYENEKLRRLRVNKEGKRRGIYVP